MRGGEQHQGLRDWVAGFDGGIPRSGMGIEDREERVVRLVYQKFEDLSLPRFKEIIVEEGVLRCFMPLSPDDRAPAFSRYVVLRAILKRSLVMHQLPDSIVTTIRLSGLANHGRSLLRGPVR